MPLKIVRNDITKMETEAIVNTANKEPVVGRGCDSAVYKAAGFGELLSYRKKNIGTVPEGSVFITPGFHLKAKYIIHAVSPLYKGGVSGEEKVLRGLYQKCLELASLHGIKSISFPLISTGAYGYPKEEGLRIAVDEIYAFLLDHEMEVFLVVFDSAMTGIASKLSSNLDEYIDENYVDEKSLLEYKEGLPFGPDVREGSARVLQSKDAREGSARLLQSSHLKESSARLSQSPDFRESKVRGSRFSDLKETESKSSPSADMEDGSIKDEGEDAFDLDDNFDSDNSIENDYVFREISFKSVGSVPPAKRRSSHNINLESARSVPPAKRRSSREINPEPAISASPAKRRKNREINLEPAKSVPPQRRRNLGEKHSSSPKDTAINYDEDFERLENSLSERLRHRSDTFSEYLLFLIKQKGLTNADVYKKAVVDKKVFSKIKNNPSYHPTKITALCLCIGARLNLDETKDLLSRAGYALSPCDKTDIIFSYFIENGIYDMIELDIQLEEHGLPCMID